MTWTRELVATSRCVVEAKIRGQARPRHTRGGHTYTVPADRAAQKLIAGEFAAACGTSMAEWPDEVELEVHCYRRYPDSYVRWREGEPDICKPDSDNIGKLVKDALNGVAWADDCQVTSDTTVKHPRFKRPCDRMEITVRYYRNTCERGAE